MSADLSSPSFWFTPFVSLPAETDPLSWVKVGCCSGVQIFRMSLVFRIRQLVTTTLTGFYLRRKLRLSVCKGLGSSPSITIPSKILIDSNTHCHRVKGHPLGTSDTASECLATLGKSPWKAYYPCLPDLSAWGKNIWLLENTPGAMVFTGCRWPQAQEPCQLLQKVTSLPGLGGTAWASGPAPVDEHLGQRLSSVMMWLVSM